VATSRIAEQLGRVLGDRYRLLRPLGTGASAHVYVAEDVALRRRVAVKVLHPALAEDQAFGRRFRAEAQVVAALRHPNILRVYDWGTDGGSPYLVTELLEGGSLRGLLDAGHMLSPAQAARMGADAARALAHAHGRGLVHRDVKPANLLFDDEGRVCVADFGLARALAEASWTEPSGAVVGTARYAAPEQARGEVLDARADVYALALVLVEATTGEVPFTADTTFSTLMARVGRNLPVPPTLGPLAPVLEAAGTPAPGDRLNATRLASALDRVATELPPASPLPLAGPLHGSDIEVDPDPTAVASDRLPRGSRTRSDMPSVWADDAGSGGHQAGAAGAGGRQLRRAPYDGEADRGDEPDTAPGHREAEAAVGHPRRRARRIVLMVAIVAVLAAGAAGVVYGVNRPPPEHRVPSLASATAAQAGAALLPLHLRLVVGAHRYDQTVPADKIIAQSPAGGLLREGKAVTVTVSLGPPPVAVPSLKGDTAAQATAALTGAHLGVGTVTSQPSTAVGQGEVISWTPAGTSVAQGTKVDVVVSSGLPMVVVPSLSGTSASSFAGAQSALGGAGLAATESQAYSDTVPAGAVVDTRPGPGTSVRLHTLVQVVVSEGPHLVAVPNVATLSVDAASQELSAAGFGVSGVSGNPTAKVTGTNPAVGTTLHYGHPVQLITG
jgi:serine/threonine-protein kinase